MSASITTEAANTSAETQSAALSAAAEKASSCYQMNVPVKVRLISEKVVAFEEKKP